MGVAKFDDGVPSNPKIIEAGATASWLWFCGVLYCRRALTDGFIPYKVVPSLSIGLKAPYGHASTLVRVGLWDNANTGFYVHDYLHWNPTKAQMESYRAKDRDRKQSRHVGHTDSERNRNGIAAESERIPEATAYTRGTHAGAKSASLSESEGFASEPPEEIQTESTALEPVWRKRGESTLPSLMAGPLTHRGHAWCCDRDGLCVPDFLHREFIGKLHRPTAHDELTAWYPKALALFAHRAIGEDSLKFWRNCFAQWVGNATSAPSGGGKGNQAVSSMQRAVEQRQAEREAK